MTNRIINKMAEDIAKKLKSGFSARELASEIEKRLKDNLEDACEMKEQFTNNQNFRDYVTNRTYKKVFN